MRNENKFAENDDRYDEGYKKAVNDILQSVLVYSPRNEDYHDKRTMRRCRDEIARKITVFSRNINTR